MGGGRAVAIRPGRRRLQSRFSDGRTGPHHPSVPWRVLGVRAVGAVRSWLAELRCKVNLLVLLSLYRALQWRHDVAGLIQEFRAMLLRRCGLLVLTLLTPVALGDERPADGAKLKPRLENFDRSIEDLRAVLK